jgi:hypothetical protein
MAKARKVFDVTIEEAVNDLRDTFRPGSTAYTILRHVARSGMSRAIDVVAIDGGDGHRWMSPRVAVACDDSWSDKHEAITVGGCGMDMGFAVVYDLAQTIYGDHGPVPLRPIDKRRLTLWRKAQPEWANTSPGYAISHRWI